MMLSRAARSVVGSANTALSRYVSRALPEASREIELTSYSAAVPNAAGYATLREIEGQEERPVEVWDTSLS
jgi:predicted phage gp36 major capsid-like protein